MRCSMKILSAIIILAGLLFLSSFVFNNSSDFVLATTDSANVGVIVTSTCPNGRCDLDGGENWDNCTLDCSCNNNGICESARAENSNNCQSDCKSAPQTERFFADITPSWIFSISVGNITMTSVEISWDTNEPSACDLSWGRSLEYGDGSATESFLKIKHLIAISELLAGTNYRFSIICRDVNQNKIESSGNSFNTLDLPDIIPPANVSNFEIIPNDGMVDLKWQNPPDSDFIQVKVVRSEKFYPIDPFDGIIVYSGKGEKFVDTGLENNKPYYYAVFTYDKNNNYSSGAISAATPHQPDIIPPPIVPVVVPAPEEVQKIKLDDFDFIQNNRKLRVSESNLIGVLEGLPLTISIDYEKIPEVLKTIMITLEKSAAGQGQENKYFSFLLRINKDKTAYETTLIPPEEIADYPLSVIVMDYKNQKMKEIGAKLVILQTASIFNMLPWQEKVKRELLFALIVAVAIEIIYRIHRKSKVKIYYNV